MYHYLMKNDRVNVQMVQGIMILIKCKIHINCVADVSNSDYDLSTQKCSNFLGNLEKLFNHTTLLIMMMRCPHELLSLFQRQLGHFLYFVFPVNLFQHLADQLDLDMSALDYMLHCYPEIKDREAMRKIVGRYGLTGLQQV